MSIAGRVSKHAAGRLRRCDKPSQLDGAAFDPLTLGEFDSVMRALLAGGLLPRDAEGRLLAPRLHRFEREAIRRAAGRPCRTGRRLRAELLAMQFVAARAAQPDLSIADFLEDLAAAH
jgi:hypothetical protein